MTTYWPPKPVEAWLDADIAVPAKAGEYNCMNNHAQMGRCQWDGNKWAVLIPSRGSLALYNDGGKVKWWTLVREDE